MTHRSTLPASIALGIVAALLATAATFPALRAQTPYDSALAAYARSDLDRAARLAGRAAAAEPGRAEVQELVGDIACVIATAGGPGTTAQWR